MKNYPYTMQDETNDSGPCCLRMMLNYYGIDEDLTLLKEKTHTTALGTSLKAMIEALESYSIETQVKEVALKDLKNEKMPCILVMKSGFVVLYEMKKKLVIADPKKGMLSLNIDDLHDYLGKAIMITHLGRYFDYHKATFKDYKKMIFKEYRHDISHLMLLEGMKALLLGLIVFSLLFLKSRNLMNLHLSLLVGLFAYVVYILMYFLLDANKKKHLRVLIDCLDEAHVLVSMKKLMLQNESYFYDGEDVCAERIEHLHDLSLSLAEAMNGRALLVGMFLIGIEMSMLSYMGAVVFSMYMIFIIILSYYYGTFKNQDGLMYHTFDEYLRKRSSFVHSRELFMNLNVPIITPFEHYYRLKQSDLSKVDRRLHKTQLAFVFLYVVSVSGLLMMTSLHLFSFNLYALCGCFVFVSYLSVLCLQQAAYFAYKNINELLYERYKKASIGIDLTAASLDPIHEITLRNVSISYGDQDVLSHLDGTLDHSCVLSGNALTTLFKCLSGTRLVVRGHIFYNHVNYNALNRKTICDHVYYVRPLFVDGTLKDNLMCENEEKIHNVFEILGCPAMMNVLEKPMSVNGAPLSARKQALLLVARALLSKQEVLLFDHLLDVFDDEEAFKIMSTLLEMPDRLIFITTSKTLKKDLPHVTF